MKLFLHKKHAECTVSVTQLAALVVKIFKNTLNFYDYSHKKFISRGSWIKLVITLTKRKSLIAFDTNIGKLSLEKCH